MACQTSACLAQLVEAASKVTSAYQAKRKLQATAPIEKALEKALSTAFKKQGSAFLGRFSKRSGDFPNLTEAATPVPDWESDFDAAADETVEAFEKPLSAAVQAALLAGQKASLATATFDIAWDLKSPGAIAYMKEHGAQLVSKVNDVSKEQIRGIIAQALDEGWSYDRTAKALTEKFAQFAVGSPLQHIDSRAHFIAVTEASHAYEHANKAGVLEMVDAGLDMEKEWIDVGDERECDICQGNADAGWIPFDEDFPEGGQTAEDSHPGCVPGDTPVLWLGSLLAATERIFNGDLVIIDTASGKHLACTPNHPILTPSGWVAAGLLDVGGYVVSGSLSEWVASAGDLDDEYVPASIHEIAEAFGSAQQVTATPVPVAPEDFHGDGEGSKVAVVWTYRNLGDGDDSAVGKHVGKFRFQRGYVARDELPTKGALERILGLQWNASGGIVSGDGQSITAGGVKLGPAEEHSLAPVAGIDTSADEMATDSGTAEAERFCQRLLRLAGSVFSDEIISIDVLKWSGHVYNLQTVDGFYSAGGIITHNCRCTTGYRRATGQKGD